MAHTKTTRSIFSLIAALMAVFLMAAPALADNKEGHDKGSAAASEGSAAASDNGKPAKDNDGDADSDSSATVTEDTDNNDGGTKEDVADEGDNAHPSGKDRSVENGNSTSNPNQGKSESDPDDDGRGPDRTNGGPDKPGGTGGADLADQDGNNGCGNDDDFEDDNEGRCGPGAKPEKNPPVKGEEVKPCDKDVNMPGTQPCEKDDEVKGGGTKPCDKDANMPGNQPCEKDEVKDGKITICHATGSSTNPFVIITISENGLNGHADHEGDIIPMNENCDKPEVGGGTIPPVDTDNGKPEPIVKGETVSRDEDEPAPVVAAERAERGPSNVEVLGAVLPFTGASLLAFVAAAFGLIAAGFAALRLRKN